MDIGNDSHFPGDGHLYVYQLLVIPNGLMPFKVMFIFTAKHDIIRIQNDNGLALVGGRNTRLLS